MSWLSRFLLGTALAGLAAGTAAAACPTKANADRGFVLTQMDGRTSLRTRPIPGDQLSTETLEDGKVVRTMVYDRSGLFPAKAINGSAVATYAYEGRIDDFRLRPGDRASYVAVARVPGRPEQRTTIEMTVTGTDEIAIGACRYPVVVIERRNSYSNGPPPNSVLAFFSPDLNVPLRTRIRSDKGDQRDHEYRSITTIGD